MARIELRHATIRVKDGFSGTAAVNEPTTPPADGDTDFDIDTGVVNGKLGTDVIPIGARFTVVGATDVTYTVTGRTPADGSATEYVLTRRNPDPAGGVDRSTSTSVFSSDAGFNLVSYEMSCFGKPEQTRRCSFREVEGIFIPSEFEYKHFRWADVEEAYLTLHRRFTLKEVQVNEPLEPGVFEIENLGLEYGDRMVDRIENRLTVFDGKQFVPAEQFILRPELLPGQTAEPRRD